VCCWFLTGGGGGSGDVDVSVGDNAISKLDLDHPVYWATGDAWPRRAIFAVV